VSFLAKSLEGGFVDKDIGLGVSELRRLRQLDEENRRLKRMVADLSLDKQLLQDVLSKNSKASPLWLDHS